MSISTLYQYCTNIVYTYLGHNNQNIERIMSTKDNMILYQYRVSIYPIFGYWQCEYFFLATLGGELSTDTVRK